MKKSGSQVWITRHQDGWQVKRPHAERASAVVPTQEKAINIGTKIAKHDHAELFVTGRDGKIRERNSFGNDPRDIRG